MSVFNSTFATIGVSSAAAAVAAAALLPSLPPSSPYSAFGSDNVVVLSLTLAAMAAAAWWYRSQSSPPAAFYQEPAALIEAKAGQLTAALTAGAVQSADAALDADSFDVCIMGGGAAGLMQARHMQLECPGLRICMIDPLSAARTEVDDDCHKIGESTVFTSATFLVRDLNLHEYLIMNHYPKHGLFYHWAKDVARTDTLTDYFSALSLTLPEVPSFQIDRPKFERDLLQMVLQGGGVTYIQGKVTKLTFADEETKDGAAAIVHGEQASVVEVLANQERRQIRAAHLVDAAGRAFLVAKRKNLLITKPTELMDIENAAVWLQVNDLDSSMLVGDAARGQTLASWLFATNHFCGDGHWLWVIPVKNREEQFSLSIGVSFHKQKHQLSQFNDQDKFLAFLHANHRVLYNVIMSGTIGLFRTLPRLPHVSTQFYDAAGRWYVIGEAAYNADPWFSTGLAWCSVQIQHVTALVRAKTAARRALQASTKPDARAIALSEETNRLYSAYDGQAGALTKGYFLVISRHWKHLGNASIMSWRLLFETCAPAALAAYFSKMYLCPIACRLAPRAAENRIWLLSGVYDLFDELVDAKVNVGFMDYNEPGRVPVFGSEVPLDFLAADENLRGGKYTFRSANIAKSEVVGSWFLFCALATLVWRGFGLRGFLRPAVYQRLGYLLRQVIRSSIASAKHSIKHRHQITNRRYHDRESQFSQYKTEQYVMPW